MKFQNLPLYTHNIDQISDKVFGLSNQEKGILYHIAREGPSILTEIAEFTSSLEKWYANRWSVKRRIDGTGDYIGLIKSEYLIGKEHEKRIPGKDGKLYFLTTKGMLASLSTGISIGRIYLFKKYKRFLKTILERPIQKIGSNKTNINTKLEPSIRKWLFWIFENFIKYKIYTFLIWHEASDISLKKKRSMQWYFYDFYENNDEFINSKFPEIDRTKQDEYKEILRNNLRFSKLLHSLDEFCLSDNPRFQHNSKQLAETLKINLAMVIDYVWYWPFYNENLQFYNKINEPYRTDPVPSILTKPNMGIDIEATGEPEYKKLIRPRLFDLVKNDLSPLGIENTENFLREIWHDPLKSPKILEYGRIPN